MTRFCADCGNPLGNAFGGRRHYCFHTVKVQHDAEVAAGELEEQEGDGLKNNEAERDDTPDP